jgi:hypothetical protein
VKNQPNAWAWYITTTASKPILKFFGDQRNTSVHRQPVSPIKELQIVIEDALRLEDAFSVEHGEDGVLTYSPNPPSAVVAQQESKSLRGNLGQRDGFCP